MTSVLNRLAYSQNRRDEVPNQVLARDLAARKDMAGIREIVENLRNKNKNIQADCIKVLYEIGYVNPDLIASYAEDFFSLLKSKNNRLVWGGMIALSTIAAVRAEILFAHIAEIQKAMKTGSVITVDNAVATLARVASVGDKYNQAIFPFLLQNLKSCRPKDVAQHAEKSMPSVTTSNNAQFIKVLERRMEDLSGSGLTRVKKVIKQAHSR